MHGCRPQGQFLAFVDVLQASGILLGHFSSLFLIFSVHVKDHLLRFFIHAAEDEF